MAEFQGGALRLGAVMSGDQGAEAGTVDEGDVVHVEDDFLFAFGDQTLHFFAQCVAFFTEHDAAIQGYDGDAVHFAIRKFQCHFVSSSSEKGSGAWTPSATKLINNSLRRTCNNRKRYKSTCSGAIRAAANRQGNSTKRVRRAR